MSNKKDEKIIVKKDAEKKVEVLENLDDESIQRRKALKNRIRTIVGHLNGIEKMIDEGKSCDEIMIQVSAVKSSVHRVGAIILEEYAKDCFMNRDDELEESRERIRKLVSTLVNFSQ